MWRGEDESGASLYLRCLNAAKAVMVYERGSLSNNN